MGGLADIDPTSWSYQNELSVAYKKKGDIDREIQGWKSLINRHPRNGWWFEDQLVKAFAKKGDYEEANITWKELYDKSPMEGWRLQFYLVNANKAKLEKK